MTDSPNPLFRGKATEKRFGAPFNQLTDMQELNDFPDLLMNSLRGFGQSIAAVLPRLIGALIILLIGWLIAKLVAYLVLKLLQSIKFNQLTDKVGAGEMLRKANMQLSAAQLISRFVYWILLLFVIITAADVMGWAAVSQEISKLISYLPQLLSALVFFVIGYYIAGFVRDLVRGAATTLGISAGRIVSTVIYYLLLLLVSLTALDQAGVDTTILTSNFLVILGAVMLAAAISYGFASRHVLANILAAFFNRRTVQVGQLIEFKGQRGRVVEINALSVVLLLAEKDKLIIPANELINSPIKVIGE